MPPRLRASQRRLHLMTVAQRSELLFGPRWRTTRDGNVFTSSFGSERLRRGAWQIRGVELVELAVEWCPRMPLGQPWAWWMYESTPVRLDWLELAAPDFHQRLLEAETQTVFRGDPVRPSV
jgi:hypothetical protein